jgi:hypothetical protein
MIFQDPMSSLNPIVKIGRQLTEAMILKGKARQKESRKVFNKYLALLEQNIAIANGGDVYVNVAKTKCENFDKFEYKHLELESAYNDARSAAAEALEELDVLMFEVEKNAAKDLVFRTGKIAKYAEESIHKYVVNEDAEKLASLYTGLVEKAKAVKKGADNAELLDSFRQIYDILLNTRNFTKPNFFAMGYYMTYATEPMPELPVEELNVFLRKYLDENFMLDFIADAKLIYRQLYMLSVDDWVTYSASDDAVRQSYGLGTNGITVLFRHIEEKTIENEGSAPVTKEYERTSAFLIGYTINSEEGGTDNGYHGDSDHGDGDHGAKRYFMYGDGMVVYTVHEEAFSAALKHLPA